MTLDNEGQNVCLLSDAQNWWTQGPAGAACSRQLRYLHSASQRLRHSFIWEARTPTNEDTYSLMNF